MLTEQKGLKTFTLELQIVGFLYENKKNKDLISGVIVESRDGGVFLRAKSTSFKAMKKATKKQSFLINRTIFIKCSGIYKSKNSKFYTSLYPCTTEFAISKREVPQTTIQCLSAQESISKKNTFIFS